MFIQSCENDSKYDSWYNRSMNNYPIQVGVFRKNRFILLDKSVNIFYSFLVKTLHLTMF